MSTLDDPITDTDIPVYLVPKDKDGEDLVWDGNRAKIAGLMHEVHAFFVQKSLHQEYINHHAALLSSGALAVDSVEAVTFIMDESIDPRTLGNMCPPTPARVTEVNAKRSATKKAALTTASTIPEPLRKSIVYAPSAVRAAGSKLLISLKCVFGQTHAGKSDLAAASGDAYRFVSLLKARYTKASA